MLGFRDVFVVYIDFFEVEEVFFVVSFVLVFFISLVGVG